MTQAHLHLVLNHLPILGTLFGFILLLIGLLKRNNAYQKLGLYVLLFASILILPAFYTGEAAEHATERIVGSSHDMIEEHEELADKAWWLSNILAVSCIVVLVLLKKNKGKNYKGALWTVCIWSFLCLLMLFLVGTHGGKIRRPELRGENPMMIQGDHHGHSTNHSNDD